MKIYNKIMKYLIAKHKITNQKNNTTTKKILKYKQ